MSNPTIARPPAAQPVSPRELAFLTKQVRAWEADGTIAPDQTAAILSRYQAGRRFGVASLVVTLGAAFVGVGLIWLVAANLDQFAPLPRFLVVTFLWLAVTVGAEWLAAHRERLGTIGRPAAGAARLLAALGIGAVIFQAAQSLQVPAYEPALVGYWAAAALVHAYLLRSLASGFVGVIAGVVWFVWQLLWVEPSGLAVVLAFVTAGAAAIGVAGLHGRSWRAMGELWREVGALLLLIGLFAAAIPDVTTEGFAWSAWSVAGVVATLALVVAATLRNHGWARLEPVGAVAVAAVALLLVWWDAGSDADRITAQDWAHALLSVAVYVVAAAGVAALGVLRDSPRLTALAMTALVIFTTFQSFAVFAQIIEGAWVFVLLGVVFLGTGVLVDRGRRQLAATLEGEESA